MGRRGRKAKTFPVDVTISVNGTLANQTDYLLDGASNLEASQFTTRRSVDAADLGVNIWQPALKQINEIQVARGADFTLGDNPQATFGRANYSGNDHVHWVVGSGFGATKDIKD